MSMRAAAKFQHPINGQGRMTGNTEVILRPDLFGGQVVNALFILRRIIGNSPTAKKAEDSFSHSASLSGSEGANAG